MTALLDRTVMWLTWRQLFARRRVWYALAFALSPFVFTILFRVVADDGDASRTGFYHTLVKEIVVGTLVPLAGVVFGTTAFGGEVDDGTLVYLLVKPLPRWQLVLSKLVVAVVSTIAIAAPAIVLPWLVVRNADLPVRVPLAFLGAAVVGSAIYCAMFMSLGLRTRRALVGGLVYVIGFETMLSRSLSGTRVFSVREYENAIAQALSNGAIVSADPISMTAVKTVGTVILVGATLWTMRRLARYELAERL